MHAVAPSGAVKVQTVRRGKGGKGALCTGPRHGPSSVRRDTRAIAEAPLREVSETPGFGTRRQVVRTARHQPRTRCCKACHEASARTHSCHPGVGSFLHVPHLRDVRHLRKSWHCELRGRFMSENRSRTHTLIFSRTNIYPFMRMSLLRPNNTSRCCFVLLRCYAYPRYGWGCWR